MKPPRARWFTSRTAAVAGLLAGVALAIPVRGDDTVILKDGFVIQGNVRKEVSSIKDPATGNTFPVAKDTGFDMIDEGPKVVVFSTHARQAGEISKERLRPEYKAYTMPFAGRKRSDPLPGGAGAAKMGDFNAKWVRSMKVNLPNGFDVIEQQITYLDPFFMYMVSPTHMWRLGYRTAEMEPEGVRKLLQTHADLVEAPGKPDAGRRVAIARFMLDAGWRDTAVSDLEQIKKDFSDIPKEAKESYDKLVKDLGVATAALVIKESELALASGRYGYAAKALGAFPEPAAEPGQVRRMTELMAQFKATRESYETGRRLLRTIIDGVTGRGKANPLLAAAGGPAVLLYPAKDLPAETAALVAAAEDVYAELHPDSVARIDFFVNLAAQVERELKQGRDPSKRPDELLATAVSGWVKGKNGASPDAAVALRLWTARYAVLGYQRAEDSNDRNDVLRDYKNNKPLPIDELAQVISLLPPAEPENLLFRSGTPVPEKDGSPPGLYKYNTGPDRGGVSYVVKLPPEYHHGRAYPVVIAMAQGIDPELVIGALAFESDRHGYILVVPEWPNGKGGWDWDGRKHAVVTNVLRDTVRKFCVDNDRVFLFGAAAGADMALDVGLSHPDLFAGVLAMSPVPKWQNMFQNYWKNAQKLPVFCVTGEMSPGTPLLRLMYEQWMRYGFPGLMVIYKGRGIEWFPAETPVMFDWMSRKKRVNGNAVLQLSTETRFRWNTMRPTDNRFYWIAADEISERHQIDNVRGQLVCADIQGDITGGNVVRVNSRGVTKLSLWLSQDMIDWTKPLAVNVNGAVARDPAGKEWRAQLLQPDLKVLLDDYRDRGDRRMLYLKYLTFMANP